jgi:hypothetical protein
MKHYVTAPGVVRADVVLVQSENMKRNYVEKLTEFAGSGTRDIWEKKISTVEDVQCDPTDDDCGRQGIICERQEIAIKKQRKKMMYCIGLNEIFEHREDIIKKVHDRLDIMKEKADKLYTAVCIYPPDKEVWLKAAPDEAGKIFDLIAKFDEKMKCVQTEEDIGASEEMLDSFDAYYGSPTYYAHYFNFTGKPVMLCDYSIDS